MAPAIQVYKLNTDQELGRAKTRLENLLHPGALVIYDYVRSTDEQQLWVMMIIPSDKVWRFQLAELDWRVNNKRSYGKNGEDTPIYKLLFVGKRLRKEADAKELL